MVPIIIDTRELKIAVVGHGPRAVARIDWLRGHDAVPHAVFCPEPGDDLARAAGDALISRWPSEGDLAVADIVFAAGLESEQADRLRARARRAKALLNIEDLRSHCDFHVPATVRRGDLLLTVSTGGASPGLARRIARRLGELFGPQWSERLAELSGLREGWRAAGMDVAALARETDRHIDQKGWFS